MIRSLLTLAFSACILCASPVPDFPHLSVNAIAYKAIAPDEATITFTVLSFKETSEEAIKDVDTTLRKTVQQLTKLGIKEDEITAADLEKSVTRERNKDYQRLKIIGYEVKRTIEVKLSDVKLYTKAATLIFKTDLIKNVNSSFGISSREEVLLSLFGEACNKAKKKAAVLEKAADVKILRIHGISPTNEHYQFGYSEPADYGMVMSSALPSMGEDELPPLFVPKEISLEVSVDLLFELAK